MNRTVLVPAALLFLAVPSSFAYIEVPHSLGKCVHDSTNIVLMEVSKVNQEKGLIIFKKVTDLKGKHPADEVKHNIGKRGFHEREWKSVMAWAEAGKKAVFLYNGDASETCIGTYWYQCYREGDWWGMSHAEPFLLRTFYGEADRLADLVAKILKNEEVVVTCLADGNKEHLHQRKGKLQRMKASLKKLDYDPKKDFVGFGDENGEGIDEFKTTEIIPASSKGWRYLSSKEGAKFADVWFTPTFDDAKWKEGKAPLGHGEEEIQKRQGTEIAEKGVDFLFRKVIDLPAETLATKDAKFFLNVASDDNARVYLNGVQIDQDPADDHEFAYWNREIEIVAKALKPGKNLLAFRVKNKPGSSDLYLDAELVMQVPLPKKAKPKAVAVATTTTNQSPKTEPAAKVEEYPRDPNALVVDKAKKTVTLNCVVAQRKLPNLDQTYPIEVIASYPYPRGQKAHETVVTFKGVKPSEIHQALTDLGLKPGKPAYGENAQAAGPEVKVYLEVTKADGKTERLTLDQCLVHRETNKPMVGMKWLFTGSAMKQPDPEKDDKVYGADLTGTLLSLFPVTDACVLQTTMTMKDEPNYKLEVNSRTLPKEGTAVKLILALE
jgi:hypothetical protein